ncbi:MAG: hypothetical protein HRF43_11875 [Phycisphaerae bacterium]|jgi:hypothetical protein
MFRSQQILAGTGLILAAAIACRRADGPRAPATEAGEAFAVRRSYGGPVTFTVELSKPAITTADSLKLRLTLEINPGYEAEFPDLAFPDDLPGAILTGYEERESKAGDRRVLVREYELEPEYEGALTLPRMEVYSHRTGEVKEEVVASEPVEVTVKSHHETAGDLAFRPMRGLVTVDAIVAERRRVWPWLAGAAGTVLALAVLTVWLARRPRRLPPPPPAHETALARLRQLAGRGLIAAGEAEAFFVEVTGIVRDYVEQAFGVRAPEQTTEEFLAGLVSAPAILRHRHVLEPFLTAADEVKFARMRPDAGAMQRAFDTAENFVRQTSQGAGVKP